MYKNTLTTKPEALKQVLSLIVCLNQKFQNSYDGAFNTRIMEGEPNAVEELSTMCQEVEHDVVNRSQGRKVQQASNHLDECFDRAFKVQRDFDPFMRRIAESAGCRYVRAPFKRTFRALEKIMLRHDENDRDDTGSVLDILRGAIHCPTVVSIKRCLKAIVDDADFRIDRIKDRFSLGKQTTAHWRDLMLNGHFVHAFRNRLTVEIQIHHETLITVREKLGGHFMYSKVRSLVEAVEVVFGVEEAARLLSQRRNEILALKVRDSGGHRDLHEPKLTEQKTRSVHEFSNDRATVDAQVVRMETNGQPQTHSVTGVRDAIARNLERRTAARLEQLHSQAPKQQASVRNISAPECERSHVMEIKATGSGAYANGWICNICSSAYPAGTRRWMCSVCSDDICFRCAPETIRSPTPSLQQQQPLRHEAGCANCLQALQSNRPPAGRSFTCDTCRCRIPNGAVMYSCRKCDFDLCARCRTNAVRPRLYDTVRLNKAGHENNGALGLVIKDDRDRTPYTICFEDGTSKSYFAEREVELLGRAPSLYHPHHTHELLRSPGSYVCDVCRRSTNDSSRPRFRCQGCDWDACLRCMTLCQPSHPAIQYSKLEQEKTQGVSSHMPSMLNFIAQNLLAPTNNRPAPTGRPGDTATSGAPRPAPERKMAVQVQTHKRKLCAASLYVNPCPTFICCTGAGWCVWWDGNTSYDSRWPPVQGSCAAWSHARLDDLCHRAKSYELVPTQSATKWNTYSRHIEWQCPFLKPWLEFTPPRKPTSVARSNCSENCRI